MAFLKNRCCICGPVKNCGAYLSSVFRNIEKIGSLFEEYVILIYYDHSIDNTLKILTAYQLKNPRLRFFVNQTPVSPYRTHRIAHARNQCLDFIKERYSHFPFFIMMDFDDPNSKQQCNIHYIQKYLERSDWDALSFNTSPAYYDIWGLSIYPFCYSYNHFKNNNYFYKVIQHYVTLKLNDLKPGQLLPCISSFNGFAIYRTNLFLHCKYDGKVNLRLASPSQMLAHKRATNSPIIFKDYGHVKGRYEDCEHRAFHVQAITQHNAKIMIAPEVLFT